MYKKSFAMIIMIFLCCISGIVYGERVYPYMQEKVVMTDGKLYEKCVAITFDDGPGYRTTELLLDGLSKRGVVASFFIVGENIEGREALIARMNKEGHLIGNHTFSHIDLTKIPLSEAQKEVDRTNVLLDNIIGETPAYIRPPCGNWNDELLFSLDMQPVMWSVDPEDWKCHDVNTLVNRVMRSVHDGDIILFHDIYDSSVVAALEIVDRLLAEGYVFVTVDELLIE